MLALVPPAATLMEIKIGEVLEVSKRELNLSPPCFREMDFKEKSESECMALLSKIFLAPDALISKFAPNGWERSPFFAAKYPSPQERYERSLQMHRNIKSLAQKAGRSLPEPRLEDFENEPPPVSDSPLEDLLDLLGDCVWSVFSENHDVVAPDGAVYHLGSWRGSGGFIADFINEHYPVNGKYGYLDFYMGLLHEEDRAKCSLIFSHIFEVLKQEGCDWRYSFPGMGIVSFAQPPQTDADPTTYDPAAAMQAEMEYETKQREIADLQARLDKEREEAMEAARYQPPPPVVQVYRDVFGKWPEGWVASNE